MTAYCKSCGKTHAPRCDRCGRTAGQADFRSLHGPCDKCAFPEQARAAALRRRATA